MDEYEDVVNFDFFPPKPKRGRGRPAGQRKANADSLLSYLKAADGCCTDSNEKIAEHLGFSPTSISRYVSELSRTGRITVKVARNGPKYGSRRYIKVVDKE